VCFYFSLPENTRLRMSFSFDSLLISRYACFPFSSCICLTCSTYTLDSRLSWPSPF
jgi:hypothetical protein